ncbi:MAG TPA: methionine biosynthesis protein MetW [Nitrospiraceae bacterium]|jgi:methionine biosynthesis protein MetW|nr:methionine biosynthesis protein MetW [Nitrospiraceae bacterium]
MVSEGASVLDLGCGAGELLYLLTTMKRARGRGVEVDDQAIYECVRKGLSVFHDDIDKGLGEFGNGTFDYVLLNHSLQQVRKPDIVLKDALRVGNKVIVSFPNFAHFEVRSQILFKGRTPVTPALPYEWHDTPNMHFLSILDFEDYCRKNSIKTEKTVYVTGEKIIRSFPNLLAQEAIFLISMENHI